MTSQVIVGAVSPRVQYIADGWQAEFPFPFVIFKEADLQVWVGEAVMLSGYTVSGVASSNGGAVVLAVPPPANTRVTLRRKLTIERLSDFQEGGAFRAKVINDQLDFLTAALQELEAELARAVTLAPAAPAPASLHLPPAVPGKAIGWADDGQSLVNDPTDFTTTVQVVQQWATDAEGAVQSAHAAASAAGGSASAAAASAATANAGASSAALSAAGASASESTALAARLASQAARQGAEAFADAAAFSAWLTGAERQAAIAAAEEAALQADSAASRAAQALARLEDVDLALWRAERAARRAEAAASRLGGAIVSGIGPGAMLPNWARTE